MDSKLFSNNVQLSADSILSDPTKLDPKYAVQLTTWLQMLNELNPDGKYDRAIKRGYDNLQRIVESNPDDDTIPGIEDYSKLDSLTTISTYKGGELVGEQHVKLLGLRNFFMNQANELNKFGGLEGALAASDERKREANERLRKRKAAEEAEFAILKNPANSPDTFAITIVSKARDMAIKQLVNAMSSNEIISGMVKSFNGILNEIGYDKGKRVSSNGNASDIAASIVDIRIDIGEKHPSMMKMIRSMFLNPYGELLKMYELAERTNKTTQTRVKLMTCPAIDSKDVRYKYTPCDVRSKNVITQSATLKNVLPNTILAKDIQCGIIAPFGLFGNNLKVPQFIRIGMLDFESIGKFNEFFGLNI